jgi:hypothetical protein
VILLRQLPDVVRAAGVAAGRDVHAALQQAFLEHRGDVHEGLDRDPYDPLTEKAAQRPVPARNAPDAVATSPGWARNRSCPTSATSERHRPASSRIR